MFLTFSKALFTIGFIYIRLRMSFFNADALGIELNQTITFEQALSFLDNSLLVDSSSAKSISFSSSFCSKFSSGTNHLVLPFLIQTRGMGTKAVAQATAKTIKEMVVQSPGVFFKSAVAAISSIAAGVGWILHDDFQNRRKIEAASALNEQQIKAAAEANEQQIKAAAEANERLIQSQEKIHGDDIFVTERTLYLNSLAKNEKTRADLGKRWFPDPELKADMQRHNAVIHDFLQKQSTTLVDRKIETAPFLMGSLEKKVARKLFDSFGFRKCGFCPKAHFGFCVSTNRFGFKP